jgi:hypothetical protein
MSMSMMSYSTTTASSAADPITHIIRTNTCLTEKDCKDQAKVYGGLSLYREMFHFLWLFFFKGDMGCTGVYWGRGGTEEQIEEQIDYFREKVSCS